MIGLVLALLWAVIVMFVQSGRAESAYADCTSFLYYWYLICNIFTVGLASFILFSATVIGAGKGAAWQRRHLGGFFGGMIGGGMLGAGIGSFAFLLLMFQVAMFVGGAWLLKTADDGAQTFAQFNMPKLIFGAIFILVGIIWSNSKSRSE